MKCYCCNTDYPPDQFRVFVGGEWVPIGLSRACIEYAKVYARQRARSQKRELIGKAASKQARYAA